MGSVVFDAEENVTSARTGMETMRPGDAPPITSTSTYFVTGLHSQPLRLHITNSS